jgi:hypothetical protein
MIILKTDVHTIKSLLNGLFNVSSSVCITSNYRMNNERGIAKDMDESCCGLNEGTIPALRQTEENHTKPVGIASLQAEI